MAEKKEPEIIYPSTAVDLVVAFEESPDILYVKEYDDGGITIDHKLDKRPNIRNRIIADIQWSIINGDKPCYPTVTSRTNISFVEIVFKKDGYIVEYKDSFKLYTDKHRAVEDILDTVQRGLRFIEIFRTLPMDLRTSLGSRCKNLLDCKLDETYEPTLDCVSLTLRAISMVQSGKIHEIDTKEIE